MTDTNPEHTTNDKPIHCYFFDPASNQGRNPGSKCQGQASGFVRVKHTGRLCPLCGSCKDGFMRAEKEMPEDVRKSIPGSGQFEEVSLETGAEEFRKQAPKKTA